MNRRRLHITLISLLVVAGLLAGGAFLAGPRLLSLVPGASGASQSSADLSSFPFQAPGGQTVTLADFRGRAVLLNVWATWCPPCRTEMPSLDNLQVLKGGPEFEVVALSIDNGGLAQVQPFYDEIGIKTLKVFLDPQAAVMQAIKIQGLPTTLLISRDGRELKRWVGPKEWDSAETVTEIEALLAEAGKD